MQFFAAAEGVGAPGLDAEGDHWRALCPLRDGSGRDGGRQQQRVALGSAHARYCVLDVRPSQGYPVLRAWWAPGDGRRLEALRHCAATGQFWALERGLLRRRPRRAEDAGVASVEEPGGADQDAAATGGADESEDGNEEEEKEEVFELVRYAGVDGADEGPTAGRAAAVLGAPAATIGCVGGCVRR